MAWAVAWRGRSGAGPLRLRLALLATQSRLSALSERSGRRSQIVRAPAVAPTTADVLVGVEEPSGPYPRPRAPVTRALPLPGAALEIKRSATRPISAQLPVVSERPRFAARAGNGLTRLHEGNFAR